MDYCFYFQLFTLSLSLALEEEYCEYITLPMCEDLPYNKTRFPNSFSHNTQGDADLALSTFAPLVQYGCSPALKLLLCSLYVPKCSMSGTVIKPCKGLCKAVKTGCEPVLTKFGFPWPHSLACDNLPLDGNCIRMAQSGDTSPEFADTDANVTIIEGQTTRLSCHIRNIGDYKVVWIRQKDQLTLTFEDLRIIDDSRFSVIHEDPGDYTLVIQNVNQDDQGAYICTVNTDPLTEWTVNLMVTEFQPAHILPERSSSNLRIREFGSATLVCQAIGNPEPSITWSVKPFSGPPSGVTCGVVPFESVNCPTPLMHVVHILNITRHCAGIYECIASNGATDTLPLQIDVIDHQTPVVTVLTPLVTTIKGGSAFLRCRATVTNIIQSHVTVSWSKDGRPLSDDTKHNLVSTLTQGQYMEVVLGIRDVDDNDFGEYVCTAELTTIGEWTATATVEEIPDVPTTKCRSINIDVCQDQPYTSTNYPNTMQAGHYSQFDAQEMLFTLARASFSDDNPCMKGHKFFRCSMLLPPCTSTGDIALPCKKECQVFKKRCFSSYWMTWHDQFECDKLPDQGDCVSRKSMDALDTDDGSQPFVTFLPERLEQVHGGSILIQCIAKIYPFWSLYFEKNGQVLYNSPTSTNHKVEFYNEGYYTYGLLLHVKEMQHSDFGTYKCVAKNSFGTSVKEITVNEILNLDALSMDAVPAVTTNSSRVKSVIGQSASLYFTVTLSHQGSKIRVKRGDIIFKTSNRLQIDRLPLPQNQYLFVVKLMNVSDEDQGDYTLELTDGVRVINGTAKLLVGITPKVTVDAPIKFIPRNQFEGSFNCEVHYGKNSYRWKLKKNGKTIDEHLRIMVTVTEKPKEQTDVLNVAIWEFTEEDAGQYTCVATNLHGSSQDSIILQAATIPEVTVSRTLVTSDSGSDIIQLTCRVEAYPIADVYWTKGSVDEERLSKTRLEQIEQQVDEATNIVTSVLTITGDNDDFPVEYFCIGENAVGKQHASVLENGPGQ